MIVRMAAPNDAASIVSLVRELADYEHALHEVQMSSEDLTRVLFDEDPHVFCHVVESEGSIVAMALWFLTFSTWTGTTGLYLEDLYVQEAFRGRGLGKLLMHTLAALCVQRGFVRFEWSVLDWNTPSIDFYRSIGAHPLDEWTRFRLSGDELREFGVAS